MNIISYKYINFEITFLLKSFFSVYVIFVSYVSRCRESMRVPYVLVYPGAFTLLSRVFSFIPAICFERYFGLIVLGLSTWTSCIVSVD